MNDNTTKKLMSFHADQWTYAVSFDSAGNFESEQIFLMGDMVFDTYVPNPKRVRGRAQIGKKNTEHQHSEISIHEESFLLSIYLPGDQWFRIFSEFKEMSRIERCRVFMDFEALEEARRKQKIDGIEFRFSVVNEKNAEPVHQ